MRVCVRERERERGREREKERKRVEFHNPHLFLVVYFSPLCY